MAPYNTQALLQGINDLVPYRGSLTPGSGPQAPVVAPPGVAVGRGTLADAPAPGAPPSLGGQSFGIANQNAPNTAAPVAAPAAPADPWLTGLQDAWTQGHPGQQIPQDQIDYFTRRKNEEAASGNGRPDSYWFMRATGLHEQPASSQYASGQNPNLVMLQNILSGNQSGGLNDLIKGSPYARINQSLSTINGGGQVNLDSLVHQLQGV